MTRLICRTAAVVALLLSLCSALSYRTCESSDGRIEDMSIPGCEAESCIMRRGETKTIHVLFIPYRPVEVVTTVVHVKVGWFSFPVALNEPDACLHSLHCPLSQNTDYEYVFNITIDNSTPKFSGTIRWELRDEADQDLICAEFAGGIS